MTSDIKKPEPTYFVGLDLGKAADFTALVVLEKPPRDREKEAAKEKPVFLIRHLQRFPLGTKYTAIVTDVVNMVSKPPLEGCTLIVDSTGVGSPVVDLLRESQPKAMLRPIIITGGNAISAGDDGSWHVSKGATRIGVDTAVSGPPAEDRAGVAPGGIANEGVAEFPGEDHAGGQPDI